MKIEDVDLSQLHQIDDKFLTEWIQKDMITSRYFCYLMIDKRNLTENFNGNEMEMLTIYCQQLGTFARRYAQLSFNKDFAEKLELRLLDMQKIKETYEEEEDTTWLLYQFVFVYLVENEHGEKCCACTASFIKNLKCDYMPKMPVSKVVEQVPELSGMKAGEMKAIRKDTIEKIIEVVKNEKVALQNQ